MSDEKIKSMMAQISKMIKGKVINYEVLDFTEKQKKLEIEVKYNYVDFLNDFQYLTIFFNRKKLNFIKDNFKLYKTIKFVFCEDIID